MNRAETSREFSICLRPDAATAQDVLRLRQQLPDSPYRDDPPHVSLLRGITTPVAYSDDELLQKVERVCNLTEKLPLSATIDRLTNKSNQFYSESSIISFHLSSEFTRLWQQTIHLLHQNDFAIEESETKSFSPHMTVRLGVPLKQRPLSEAQNLFAGKAVKFSSWCIFRLYIEDQARLIRVISR